MSAVDRRLLDAVAMCLCWAEFNSTIPSRTDTPAAYWGGMAEDAREKYYRDATPIALAMMNDKQFAVVPAEATPIMLEEGMHSGTRYTRASMARFKRLWSAMVRGAREEMQWRQPSTK